MMSSKCIVHGCVNHKDQGRFEGDICTPCHAMLITGRIMPSHAFFVKEVYRLQDKLAFATACIAQIKGNIQRLESRDA